MDSVLKTLKATVEPQTKGLSISSRPCPIHKLYQYTYVLGEYEKIVKTTVNIKESKSTVESRISISGGGTKESKVKDKRASEQRSDKKGFKRRKSLKRKILST